MKFLAILIILPALISLIPVLTYGAESISEEEILRSLNLEELLEIKIYSATKSEESISDAPANITVVTKSQIKKYGWECLNDILYAHPGFYQSKDYDRQTVSSRGNLEGWNNNHLLILIDGIPFNDNLYGSAYTWDITPLLLANSIEIIRGPGSALYGTNAINGVVSINTPKVSDLDRNGLFAVNIGNNGKRVVSTLAGHENRNLGIILGYNSSRNDGNEYESYDDFRNRNNQHPEKYQIRDSHATNYFFAKMYGKEKFKGFSLQYHLQAWEFNTGHGWLWVIPDNPETMIEYRTAFVLRYRTPTKSKLKQEYALKYQRHSIEWNMRYYPNGYLNNLYPSGMTEFLETDADEIFSRAQISYDLQNEAVILAGIENTVFLYDGDNEHYSNIDLDDQINYPPNPDGKMLPAGAWLEWIQNNAMYNLGIFTQYKSGKILGDKIEGTLGLRYDHQWFTYNDTSAFRDEGNRNFEQLSPRFGLVYKATDKLRFKSMIGRAFRAPTPTELFGSNTWSLASNLHELDPEIITTYEIAADWRINRNLNWRCNLFYTSFENQIAYSTANKNLSTNIYDLETAGIESELNFTFGYLSGFFNYSFARRVNETIIDTLISESNNELTWAPENTLSAGLSYTRDHYQASLTAIYQGEVKRRASDYSIPVYNVLRSENVDSWLRLNFTYNYNISENFSFHFRVNNLLNSQDHLIKNQAYPFDYRMLDRLFIAGLNISI